MGLFNWAQRVSIPEIVYSVMNDDHVELYQIVKELGDGVKQRPGNVYERDVQRLHLCGIIRMRNPTDGGHRFRLMAGSQTD